jgi:hypothetical protein
MKAKYANQNETLVTRIGNIERNVSLLGSEFEREISESLSPVTQRLSLCETSLERHSSTLSTPRPSSPPTPVSPVSRPKSGTRVAFPLKQAKSLDGIISHLTRKHGEHVQDNGIVTLWY